ncbi:glycosyltransferase family 2 protein [Limibacter armeniacum]|uniref:glycosyltransferase family 2 protein n=1 Tax=Limibacter armeniacum TaxID=466084 RepID=UPI002FE6975F
MKENYPLVSIVSVNYKQQQYTEAFLESLTHISYPNYEVILVDNASGNFDRKRIEDNYPETIIIESEENLGFAGGNNLGMRAASGKYFMLLNNDTEVEPDFLEPIVELMEKKPIIGLVSPKIKYSEGNNLIQYAGTIDINPITLRGGKLGHLKEDDGTYDRVYEVPFANGAAMMISRALFELTEGMLEDYFLYYEETDWSQRIRNLGYKIYYQGKSTVYHKESASVGSVSPLKSFYMSRNRLLYGYRNIKGLNKWLSIIYTVFVAYPFHTLKLFLSRDWELIVAQWKGVFAFLQMKKH